LHRGEPLGPVYSVPGPDAVDVRGLAAVFAEATGRLPEVVWGARPYRECEVMRPFVGETLPGWAASISLEEGLRRVYGPGGKG
jgi:nucleoside-diphosphate-sugar epimerase